jgi:transcription termination/antitermination protein NusG
MNEEEEKQQTDDSAVAVAEPHEAHEGAGAEPATESAVDEGTPAEGEKPVAPAPPPSKRRWYVVKVQSGREDSIRNAIERRVKIDGLEEFIGRILIPTEKVTELRNGKRVVKKRKKFPGYLMCEVEFNDRVLYLFRETSGVGDFVGGSLHKLPTPMNDREVERMLMDEDEKPSGAKGGEETVSKQKIIIPYGVNDRVKIRDGTFKDMEGEVKEITHPSDPKENPKVKVVLTIWGRPVDVEVEYWQVDAV